MRECMHCSGRQQCALQLCKGAHVFFPCRFGFIGSPLPCLNACTAQGASNVLATPNYNAEADGMASIVSHELVETASDPLINAWWEHLRPSIMSLNLCWA